MATPTPTNTSAVPEGVYKSIHSLRQAGIPDYHRDIAFGRPSANLGHIFNQSLNTGKSLPFTITSTDPLPIANVSVSGRSSGNRYVAAGRRVIANTLSRAGF